MAGCPLHDRSAAQVEMTASERAGPAGDRCAFQYHDGCARLGCPDSSAPASYPETDDYDVGRSRPPRCRAGGGAACDIGVPIPSAGPMAICVVRRPAIDA
jgi:hypothetical protein